MGSRYDPTLQEFQLRCEGCREKGRASFWPLTLEFWVPRKSMARCRACHNEDRNRSTRDRRASDPEYRAREQAANRQARREMGRIWYAQRWERLKADPIAYAEYKERRRAQGREASKRYRDRQREQVAA